MKNLNRTIKAESGNSSNRDSLLTHMEKKREDVVYKTIIRSVRRFYLKLFKNENPLLIRKRFRNVKSAVFYEAIKKMINRHINVQISSNLDTKNSLHTNASSDQLSCSHINKDLDTLIVFMFRFIGFKPKDKKKYGVEDEAIGKQVQSCMYNYSYPKFIQICSIPQFRIIFNNIYFFHLKSVLDEDPTLASRRSEYLNTFKSMHRLLLRVANSK